MKGGINETKITEALVGFTDNLRLGNPFSRLLIHGTRKAKVFCSPSKYRDLQYIVCMGSERVYRACT